MSKPKQISKKHRIIKWIGLTILVAILLLAGLYIKGMIDVHTYSQRFAADTSMRMQMQINNLMTYRPFVIDGVKKQFMVPELSLAMPYKDTQLLAVSDMRYRINTDEANRPNQLQVISNLYSDQNMFTESCSPLLYVIELEHNDIDDEAMTLLTHKTLRDGRQAYLYVNDRTACKRFSTSAIAKDTEALLRKINSL